MDGNVVKAAWILGGSIVLSVVLFGAGALGGLVWFARVSGDQADKISQRADDAVMEASKHVRVSFDTDNPIKVGFENKLPMALRIENSLDDAKGTRAPLVLKLNP